MLRASDFSRSSKKSPTNGLQFKGEEPPIEVVSVAAATPAVATPPVVAGPPATTPAPPTATVATTPAPTVSVTATPPVDQWLNTNQVYSIIVSKPQQSRMDIKRADIRANLVALKPYVNTMSTKLPPDAITTLTRTVEIINLLHSSPAAYKDILEDILHVFPEDTIAEPGTVSAFFTGCRMNDNFSGPPGCNPKCAGSLWKTTAKGEVSSMCNDSVLIFHDDALSISIEQETEHAYIFVRGDFNGFSMTHVNMLISHGIAFVTLVHGDYQADGSFTNNYKRSDERIPVGELPIASKTVAPPVKSSAELISLENVQLDEVEDVPESGNGAIIIFVILIIIIVAIIIFVVASRRGPVTSAGVPARSAPVAITPPGLY